MTKPSWRDFATHDESAYPELWDGVIGAWAPCLGPTGSRLHDHSRRSNWGALTNMDPPTDWIIRDGQYALDFDGTNDFIAAGTLLPHTLLDAASMSVSCWFLDRSGSGGRALVSRITATGDNGFALTLTGTNLRFPTYEDGAATISYNTNTLYHAVGVNAAGNKTVYLNAVAGTTSSTRTIRAFDGGVVLGRFYTDFSGFFHNGIIDDVMIWNRALSANEIQQLYQLGRGGMYQRRRRRAIYLPQAGFQSAWARGSNVMLGFNQP